MTNIDETRETVTGSYLEYRGKSFVREDNTIVYGDIDVYKRQHPREYTVQIYIFL